MKLALNTSTLRCPGATLDAQIEATARAGFSGIEPWVREVVDRDRPALKRRLSDAGLDCINLIGFFAWAHPQAEVRRGALEEAEASFQLAADLDCPFVAAPPFGLKDLRLPARDLVEPYQALFDRAAPYGVVPLVEYWGHSQTLGTLEEARHIVDHCARPQARLLADVFHSYKKEGHHQGFDSLSAEALGLLHLNDYPGGPEHSSLSDADRVYPGHGVAPLSELLADLGRKGFAGYASVELFNAEYWSRDVNTVAREAFTFTEELLP